MKQIKISGFTDAVVISDKPTVSVFGDEGSGKTRFAATAPDPIGLLPIDAKSIRTFKPIAAQMGKYFIAPTEALFDPKDAIRIAMLDGDKSTEDLVKIKEYFASLHKKVLDMAMKLADNKDIQTIVIDNSTILWDWILFGHFGRRNKIDQLSRAAPNNDMAELIQALKHKNLILLHRSSEIYKETGEVDKAGRKKTAPSGKFKPEGCSKLGYMINCEIEMISKPKADKASEKFKVRLRECQNKPLMEGEVLDEYGFMGEEVTWDNLMTVIGWD